MASTERPVTRIVNLSGRANVTMKIGNQIHCVPKPLQVTNEIVPIATDLNLYPYLYRSPAPEPVPVPARVLYLIVLSDVAVYRRSRKDELGRVEYYGKYEPRFKPPREKTGLGTSLKFNYLSLGLYDTQLDAEVVHQIAAFYYGKDELEGQVKLEDGSHFSTPPMSEQERTLSGKEKAKCVSTKVRKVYEEFKQEKAARSSLPRSDTLIEYSAAEIAESPFDALEDHPVLNFDLENLLDVNDVLDAFEEGFGGIPTLPSEVRLDALADDVAHHGFQRREFPQTPNVLNYQEGSDALPSIPDSVAGGSHFNSKQENLIQQLINLQEELEAEFNRKNSEQLSLQHQQHLQYQHRLEERILELQQENEDLKSTLHQVMQPLRSHLAEM